MGRHGVFEVSDWSPTRRAWTLSDLQAPFPQTLDGHQAYLRPRAWSYIGGWTGVPLRLFLERVGADLRAKYVAFQDGRRLPKQYIDMASALHPQTLLALKYGGDTLADPFWISDCVCATAVKLGYKNPKWVTAIEVTNKYPGRILGIVGLSMVSQGI